MGVGGQAKGGPSLPLGYRQWCCVPSRWQECTQTSGWIKMAIGSSLAHNRFWLLLPSDPTGPVMHQHSLIWSSKSRLWKQTWPSITTYVVVASGQCTSDSLILGHNLVSSCDILVSFCKSSHICIKCWLSSDIINVIRKMANCCFELNDYILTI